MRRFALCMVVMIVGAAVALPLAAQEDYVYTVSLWGGLGGAVDEADAGSGNSALQAGFSVVAQDRVHIGVRLGSSDFDETDRLGTLFGPSVDYVNAGAEYRFRQNLHEGGFFLGLGGYQFDGTLADGTAADETAVGLVVGGMADFEMTRKWSLLIEATGHVLDADAADFLLFFHVGVGYHF